MAPVIFFFLFGVIDFGRAGFYYVGSAGLARTAARDAAVYDTGSGYTDAQVLAMVKVQADSMAVANLTQPALCGTSTPPNPLTSCDKPPVGSAYLFIDRSSSTIVKVSIVFTFVPTTPMINAITGNMYLVATATMNKES
jgi:hypothetical protein